MSDKLQKKFNVKQLIFPFIFGGLVMTAVKLSGEYIENKSIAAIFGGIPLGLLSIYMLKDDASLKYAHNYFFITLSLLGAIAVFYELHLHTNMHKNIVLLISIILWVIFASVRVYLTSK